MPGPTAGLRLAEHGAVGDGRTAALIDATGAIDWFAPTGLDGAPSCFSLVDQRSGGFVRLGPSRRDWTGAQRYTGDTSPVLETTFETPDGAFTVSDSLDDGHLLRVLTVLRGSTEVQLDVAPGHEFGAPRKVERWSGGIAYGVLRVDGMEPGAPEWLHAGDRRVVRVAVARDQGVTRLGPERSRPTPGEAIEHQRAVAKRSERLFTDADLDGALRPAALRSLRALNLLTGPGDTGIAVLRALTTSLPARIGNERNIDERFAWLRDNAQAIGLYEALGLRERADLHRGWLAARAGDEFPLAPFYRLDGARARGEEDTVHPGWQGHGPVRVGHRPSLDVGAIAAVSNVLDDRPSWPRLEALGDWITAQWRRPDNGRWDSRARPRHHVESALGSLFALSALIATARRRNPLDLVTIEWTDAVTELDRWLRSEGCFGRNESAGWRRSGAAGADDSSDASLLPWLTGDPTALRDDAEGEARHRNSVTLDQSLAQLSEGAFTHRHLAHVDDGFPPGQGADLWASFTMVSALCSAERWDDAHARMETLVKALGPTHIGATHVDPITLDLRGNLLAAPVHLALVGAAIALSRGPR